MTVSIIEIKSAVNVVDRNSLYSARHEFSLYYVISGGPLGPIPINVGCDKCKSMCAIDLVSQPGFTRFWCIGEFDATPHRKEPYMQRCGFSLTFANQ